MALEIYGYSLQLIRDLRSTLHCIAKHDSGLARQARRALTSIPLNIAEGEGRKNGNGRVRLETAMGSATSRSTRSRSTRSTAWHGH